MLEPESPDNGMTKFKNVPFSVLVNDIPNPLTFFSFVQVLKRSHDEEQQGLYPLSPEQKMAHF
ncbi:MAG: hypothetical protein JRF28_11960 [Deltaproteobacteria bacterium]|nr:hypothetical protein [Deltaproteobacteria bacterium]